MMSIVVVYGISFHNLSLQWATENLIKKENPLPVCLRGVGFGTAAFSKVYIIRYYGFTIYTVSRTIRQLRMNLNGMPQILLPSCRKNAKNDMSLKNLLKADKKTIHTKKYRYTSRQNRV